MIASTSRVNSAKGSWSWRYTRFSASWRNLYVFTYCSCDVRCLHPQRQLKRLEEEKSLTFTPRISSASKDLASPAATEKERQATFERLSVGRQFVNEILVQIKSEYELQNCTFKPEINPSSAEKASTRYG